MERGGLLMTPEQSVPFGLLAMYAEDMYDVDQGALAPTPDSRIAASGWKIVNYLTAQDVLIPTVRNQRLSFDRAKRVFFGFLAQSNADPTSYVVAIRGTIGFAEWIIDGQFLLVPHPNHPTAKIEQGFWDIYRTMNLADPVTGATTNPDVAAGVAAVVGTGKVVVTGHSLGSALATYFTNDLAERLGNKVSVCLFASPRTGDDAWVNLFDTNVSTYQVWNYILDVVPHVPTIGYATLPNATVIQPSMAQCQIRLDLLCDHHVLCYCAMIDYKDTMAAPPSLQDASEAVCTSRQPMPESTILLAEVVTELGVGSESARKMLKGLLDAIA
jgi:hypothetical protein